MMKYKVEGNRFGEVIIFISGGGVGKWMWKKQLNYFKDKKCIALDLPGHGENSDIDFTTIKSCADMIKEIILKESKSKKATVVGHSIGAQILMFMLEHNEEVIEKAVIISGLNKPMPFISATIKPLVFITMPLIKIKSFAKIQAKQLSIPDEYFEDYYLDSLKMKDVTLKNVLYENANYKFENKSKVKIKTIILVGEKEKKIMKESAIKNKELIKESELYIIKKASHGIPYEQSDELNKLLEKFIEDKCKK